MTILHRIRSLLAGLRPRLVLVLALAVLMGAGAAAGTSYVLARRELLEQAQQKAFREIKDRLDVDVGQLTFPVAESALQGIASGLTGNVLVQTPNNAVQQGLSPWAIPAELRAAVHSGNGFAFQRTRRDGQPRLLAGVALIVQGLDGQNMPRTRGLFAALALGAAISLVAACGVRPVDPLQAGEGPTGRLQVAPVYFLDARGQLFPAQISADKTTQPSDPVRSSSTAVQNLVLLLSGATSSLQSAYGLHTEVPGPDANRTGAISVASEAGEQLVRVPFEAATLSARAKQQIACTVLVALMIQAGRNQSISPDVVIAGGATVAAAVRCPVLP